MVSLVSNGVYNIIEGSAKLFEDTDRVYYVTRLFRAVIDGLNATLYKTAPVFSLLLTNLKNLGDALGAKAWVIRLNALTSGELFRDRIPIAPRVTIPNPFKLVRGISLLVADLLTAAHWLNTMNLPVLAGVAAMTANIPLLGGVLGFTLVNLNWIRGTSAIIGFVSGVANWGLDLWRNGVKFGNSLGAAGEVAKLAGVILAVYFAKQYVVYECVASAVGCVSFLARELLRDYRII